MAPPLISGAGHWAQWRQAGGGGVVNRRPQGIPSDQVKAQRRAGERAGEWGRRKARSFHVRRQGFEGTAKAQRREAVCSNAKTPRKRRTPSLRGKEGSPIGLVSQIFLASLASSAVPDPTASQGPRQTWTLPGAPRLPWLSHAYRPPMKSQSRGCPQPRAQMPPWSSTQRVPAGQSRSSRQATVHMPPG